MPGPVVRTIKKRLHVFARRYLGLDVHSARHREFDLEPYSLDVKHGRRLLHFAHLLREIEGVDGRIVECGVGSGRSILMFSIITQYLARAREIWGFDTFEGMPPPGQEDGEHNANREGIWAREQYQVVESLKLAGIAESFIEDRVTFVPGRLQDSLRDYDGGAYCFSASGRGFLRILQDGAGNALRARCPKWDHRVRRIQTTDVARSDAGHRRVLRPPPRAPGQVVDYRPVLCSQGPTLRTRLSPDGRGRAAGAGSRAPR